MFDFTNPQTKLYYILATLRCGEWHIADRPLPGPIHTGR